MRVNRGEWQVVAEYRDASGVWTLLRVWQLDMDPDVPAQQVAERELATVLESLPLPTAAGDSAVEMDVRLLVRRYSSVYTLPTEAEVEGGVRFSAGGMRDLLYSAEAARRAGQQPS